MILRCSFCGRNQKEIPGFLVKGSAGNICDKCVRLCVEIVKNKEDQRWRKNQTNQE
jgi:ATP-dependent protease Clp ATPase subunit